MLPDVSKGPVADDVEIVAIEVAAPIESQRANEKTKRFIAKNLQTPNTAAADSGLPQTDVLQNETRQESEPALIQVKRQNGRNSAISLTKAFRRQANLSPAAGFLH